MAEFVTSYQNILSIARENFKRFSNHILRTTPVASSLSRSKLIRLSSVSFFLVLQFMLSEWKKTESMPKFAFTHSYSDYLVIHPMRFFVRVCVCSNCFWSSRLSNEQCTNLSSQAFLSVSLPKWFDHLRERENQWIKYMYVMQKCKRWFINFDATAFLKPSCMWCARQIDKPLTK